MTVKPNIVLVLFDSMRARNVSCYGYHRPTTPNLDRLASEGVRFANAFAQAPFTVASTASILTSVYPSVHRLQYYGQRLYDGLITLPEVLQSRGYYTAGFVANPHIHPASGLTRGFNYFTDGRPWYKQLPGVKRLAAWAESGKAINHCVKEHLYRDQDKPFFFFVFYNDSHVPFSDLPRILLPLVGKKYHTPDFETARYTDEEFAKVVTLYDQALQRADRRLGELFALIQNSPHAANTILLLSADHGEGLDRRFERAGHGRLFENGIHIPLVVWMPEMGHTNRVVNEMVTGLDLAPTICEWAGIDIPNRWQGRSIASVKNGDHLQKNHQYVISEYHESRCLRTDRWKLIHRGAGIGDLHMSKADKVELYDLVKDPEEEQDIARKHPDIVAELFQILDHIIQTFDQSRYDPLTYDADGLLIERLRGLGYIAQSSSKTRMDGS